jgi:Holliday junction DNA helicase RuvB
METQNEKSGIQDRGGARIERYTAPTATDEELHVESIPGNPLRPLSFADYPGQQRAKDNLGIYVRAARSEEKPLDHVLLHGPPGLGKTTLARIIANELGVQIIQSSGPSIEKPGDLAGILAGIEPRTVLFIDEIHRLPSVVEEVLYSAMEDYCLDLIVGQGPSARSVRMPIHPFTLVGATTRVSMLTRPLLGRFGIQERLEFYDEESLKTIISRTAKLSGAEIMDDAAYELARRSRGTPRTANRLFRRVRDYAVVHGEKIISRHRVDAALLSMEIDRAGLEPMDRQVLLTILERYQGGPVGVEALAHTIGEDRSTIEDVYEPFLMHRGFIARGPRGREITSAGIDHLNHAKVKCD